MTIRKLACLCAGLFTAMTAGAAEPPALTTLDPGGFKDIQQNLDINVVFIGFEQGEGATDVNETTLMDGLPSQYRPVNRFPSFYFGNEYTGLTFDFDYDVSYADAAFEDEFFGFLDTNCIPNAVTLFQTRYNQQAARSIDITSNCWIDAPSVEQWLANNAATLGVDTTEYTVFVINWYGRPDFQHHVYVKTDEPDPDTGTNFGLVRESRKITAWGGTSPDDEKSGLGSLHRIWFYDMSAGPEGWSDNWRLDQDRGYTIPPIWEYGNTAGYRPFDDLSGDIARVIRYVAIDLLFTTSPLYDPAISPPALPDAIEIDINLYEVDPNDDGETLFDLSLVNGEVGELLSHNTVSASLSPASLDGKAGDVYECFIIDVSCFGQRLFGISFADLFLYHSDQLLRYIEGDGDYEVPVFAYYDTAPLAAGGLLGFADDDWSTGTQSYVFMFNDPFLRFLAGYGFTTTTIHEVGHHVGMSHPHDGYDYEADVDFGPSGDFLFAWLGDMSNTVMSYIDLNWDFSQFDRDNMNRFATVGYINQANTILADIYASPRAGKAGALLSSADAHAAQALADYADMDYANAAMHAKLAYGDVLAAAGSINVQVEPQSYQADYKAKGAADKFVDRVDHQRMKP